MEVNFYTRNGDGYVKYETKHTLLETDIVKKIPAPEHVYISTKRFYLAFKDLK